jgi:alanyl-tRNA synthetase
MTSSHAKGVFGFRNRTAHPQASWRSRALVDLARLVQGIPPSKCVYLEDSYLQSATAEVVRVVEEKNTMYMALDQTIFHPRSGGQPSDVGTIEGPSFRLNVKRAMLQSGVIIHYGKFEGKPDGPLVTCKIDWPNRFLMMRRHTAAHLLDYCLATVRNSRVETTDSWLGDDPYVGYGGASPSNNDLKRVEELANGFIQQALKVQAITLGRANAESIIADAPNIARLPKGERLRIITIEGQLPIPCGGTHVRDLSEIGTMEVRRAEVAETGFRLHFEVK